MCEGSGNDRSRWSRLYCEIKYFSEPRPTGAVSCTCWTVKEGHANNVVSRHSSSPWVGHRPIGAPCGRGSGEERDATEARVTATRSAIAMAMRRLSGCGDHEPTSGAADYQDDRRHLVRV